MQQVTENINKEKDSSLTNSKPIQEGILSGRKYTVLDFVEKNLLPIFTTLLFGSVTETIASKITSIITTVFYYITSTPDVSLEKKYINTDLLLEQMKLIGSKLDVYRRDALGGGIVNAKIIYGNEQIEISTSKVKLENPDIVTIYQNHYEDNENKINNFISNDPDLQVCEKLLKTLLSQTLVDANEAATACKLGLMEDAIQRKENNNSFEDFLDYSFTIQKSENKIVISVNGTNTYKNYRDKVLLIKINLNVDFDIHIRKDVDIKNGEIENFTIHNENVTYRRDTYYYSEKIF